MSVNRKMSMDEFADHEASGRGGKTEFLSWKDEGDDGDGEVNLWLVDDPLVLWRNEWHRIARYEDKDKKQVEKVYRMTWNCMEESEALLRAIKKQAYWLDGDREEESRHLAEVDPFLKMLEWLRGEVMADRIDWLDEVFKWESRDGDDVSLTPAQILGIIPKPEDEDEVLEEKDLQRIKKLKLKLADARKAKNTLQCKYGFLVANHDKPERGVLMAVEAETIGNKIKQIYKHRKTRFKGDSEKAAIVRRLCLQWQFHAKKSFSDMYEVVTLDDEKASPEIEALFAKYDEEPTDVSRIAGQGNVAELEANFKETWCGPVDPPWKEFFEKAYAAVKGTGKDKLPEDRGGDTSFNHGANEKSSKKSADVLDRAQAASSATKVGEAQPDEPTVDCEACGKPMPETAMVCPHCKAGYAEFLGIVGLAQIACDACGKLRPFDKEECPHCHRTYRLAASEDVIELVPLPEKTAEPEVRASRRRQPAKS